MTSEQFINQICNSFTGRMFYVEPIPKEEDNVQHVVIKTDISELMFTFQLDEDHSNTYVGLYLYILWNGKIASEFTGQPLINLIASAHFEYKARLNSITHGSSKTFSETTTKSQN